MIGTSGDGLTVGEAAATAIASRFGTPLFVYDADLVRSNYCRFRNAISYAPSRVHYAAVCNPNLPVLRVMKGLGAGLCTPTHPGTSIAASARAFRQTKSSFLEATWATTTWITFSPWACTSTSTPWTISSAPAITARIENSAFGCTLMACYPKAGWDFGS